MREELAPSRAQPVQEVAAIDKPGYRLDIAWIPRDIMRILNAYPRAVILYYI